MFRLCLAAALLALAGCGIKAPPRPPLAVQSVAEAPPDAGCCRD